MNKALKLGRKSSEETLISYPSTKKKRNPSPRNPLKDLNSTSTSSSTAAPKGRCFSFIHRTKSPTSAPPDLKLHPSKASAISAKFPQKSLRNPLRSNADGPRRPSSKNSKKTGQRSDSELSLKKDVVLESLPDSTPDKTLLGTPASNVTPPVQVSISPEIVGGSVVAPAPVCFAAGHVITGVTDRRKCRPRGILTIGEDRVSDESRVSLAVPPLAEASMRWLSSPSDNAKAGTEGSSCSIVQLAHCSGEASVNWFLSPMDDGKTSVFRNDSVIPKTSVLKMGPVYDCENWSFSPVCSNTAASPEIGGSIGIKSSVSERTPSSGYDVLRTSTTDSSISPFSMILRRAEESSRCKVFRPYQEKCRRYGSAMQNSPFSDGSLGSGNVISTPSSHSSLGNQAVNSTARVIGNISLSPQPVALNKDGNSHLPLADISFQFGCPATPSNSIDLSQFLKPSCAKNLATEESCLVKELAGSDLRISWREGLISRIFEMDDLDCYQWLSDGEEDNAHCNGEDRVEHKLHLKLYSDEKDPLLENKNDDQRADGFGSIELSCDKLSLQKGELESTTGIFSCAESMSTDGGGLVSSGDSDWTLFYRNHLFEV
ncbi:hypothetical protein J5N97_012514 [Dioscorea zingiberensis]|uniref:Uncharacterized protein n=1 Tax=Dioscorea zingiberensis TaxID=325984 RepID=A0A9D5HHT5_9LILI|nr:hypothetical protein J5N97_012514 [Dioscorea zingiberensis]